MRPLGRVLLYTEAVGETQSDMGVVFTCSVLWWEGALQWASLPSKESHQLSKMVSQFRELVLNFFVS
jgi:hypothetical protein